MNISILTICTGKYTIFFDGFYNSCEEFLLKNHRKTYYVFTDGDIINKDNVVKVHQNKLGWPYDTMMRFHMFDSIKDKIMEHDYVYFLNVNMQIVKEINEEIIPSIENENLMGVIHPGYFNKPIESATFERNPVSEFYVQHGDGRHYYQGCFNGGKTDAFMKMSEVLKNKIDTDVSKNHIPLWHDESALNWYYKDRNVLSLSPSYAYPEAWDYSYIFGDKSHDHIEKIAMQIDKSKFGGVSLRV